MLVRLPTTAQEPFGVIGPLNTKLPPLAGSNVTSIWLLQVPQIELTLTPLRVKVTGASGEGMLECGTEPTHGKPDRFTVLQAKLPLVLAALTERVVLPDRLSDRVPVALSVQLRLQKPEVTVEVPVKVSVIGVTSSC